MVLARRRIRMTFVKGGESVTAEMLDYEAPATRQLVCEMLPMEHDRLHGQSPVENSSCFWNDQPAPDETRR